MTRPLASVVTPCQEPNGRLLSQFDLFFQLKPWVDFRTLPGRPCRSRCQGHLEGHRHMQIARQREAPPTERSAWPAELPSADPGFLSQAYPSPSGKQEWPCFIMYVEGFEAEAGKSTPVMKSAEGESRKSVARAWSDGRSTARPVGTQRLLEGSAVQQPAHHD